MYSSSVSCRVPSLRSNATVVLDEYHEVPSMQTRHSRNKYEQQTKQKGRILNDPGISGDGYKISTSRQQCHALLSWNYSIKRVQDAQEKMLYLLLLYSILL